MGGDQGRYTSGWAGPVGAASGRVFRPLFAVGRRHRRDEVAGLRDVSRLDEDLEFGHPVDGERVDERRGPAADDGGDAVALQEVLDQVRFEWALDARDLDKVGVVDFRHGDLPFQSRR